MTATNRSRPSSPTRRSNTPALPDIPEAPTPTVTPGPNAFAQQAARMERHRLEGNAFYQQEVQKRLVTPPTAVHPAMRSKVDGDIPAWRTNPEMMQIRDSNVTTMSPFINAGRENSSPPLKLVPSPRSQADAFPTRRGFLEERTEQRSHNASGDETERTPVFTYTPKIGGSEFSKSVGSTPKKRGGVDVAAGAEQIKSPRKGLLEKLRITNPRAAPNASITSLNIHQGHEGEQKVPPKAQAVLGNLPPKVNLSRSPSKKKGLFSRKLAEPSASGSDIFGKGGLFRRTTDSETEKVLTTGKTPQTASSANFSDSIGKTPLTAYTSFSDPSHDRNYHAKRIVSHSQSDAGGDKKEGKCGVSRSQSLQYFDRNAPPTPPAKNTPPHERDEKLVKESAKDTITRKPLPAHRMFMDDTPTRETLKAIDPEGRISPTKYGNYGRKEQPVLVKKPSVYSMHGSVFPDFTDPSSYEEMKSRVDGLGLEGLSHVPESFYRSDANQYYSPSVYSTDWDARPKSVIHSSPLVERDGKFKQSPSMPAIFERHRPSASDATMQTKKSTSSDGTIPVMYPELASDPSMTNLTSKATKAHHRATRSLGFDGSNEGIVPFHGGTHSRDHSNSPRNSTSSLFAKSVENVHLSPALYNCPSAMPSPLQYLPSSVYTPPARRHRSKEDDPAPDKNEDMASPLAKHNRGEELTGSPMKRHSNLFDNAPTFPPRPETSLDSHSSLRNSDGSPTRSDNTEPQKPCPSTPSSSTTSAPPFDKLDQVLAMLSGMAAQTQDVTRMREELRTMNARLDERLAASHDDLESEPPAPYVPNGGLTSLAARHRQQQTHVDMPTPDDLYPAEADTERYVDNLVRREEAEAERFGHSYEPEPEQQAQGEGGAQNAMEQLIDIVEGFARRVQALEARMGGDGEKPAAGGRSWVALR